MAEPAEPKDPIWNIDGARTGRFTLQESAFLGHLILFVSGMRRDWGLMLAPPRPEMPETWSWRVEHPGGPTLATGQGEASQGAAERAAVAAAGALVGERHSRERKGKWSGDQ